jgi:hypothetical protein
MPDAVHAINAKGRATQMMNRGALSPEQRDVIVAKADRILRVLSGGRVLAAAGGGVNEFLDGYSSSGQPALASVESFRSHGGGGGLNVTKKFKRGGNDEGGTGYGDYEEGGMEGSRGGRVARPAHGVGLGLQLMRRT